MNILISEVAEMFKLLESSYNKKNKCGFLLFNYKSIKMTDLLSKIGVKSELSLLLKEIEKEKFEKFKEIL